MAAVAAALAMVATAAPVTAGTGEVIPRRPKLIAVDLQTGKRVWRKQLSSEAGHFSLAYAGNGVVVGALSTCPGAPGQPRSNKGGPRVLVAFNERTGKQIWTRDLGAADGKSGADVELVSDHVSANGSAILATRGRKLLGLDPRTGKRIWTAPFEDVGGVGSTPSVVVITPVPDSLDILPGGGLAPTVLDPSTVRAIDRGTGSELWSHSVAAEGYEIENAVVGADTVGITVAPPFPMGEFEPPTNAQEWALDLATGRERWRHAGTATHLFWRLAALVGTTAVRFSASPLLSGVPESPVGVTAYDLHTGTQIWHIDQPAGNGSVIETAEGGIVIASIANEGTAFDAASGKRLWTSRLAGGSVIGGAQGVVVTYPVLDVPKITGLDMSNGEVLWTRSVPYGGNTGFMIGRYLYVTESCFDPEGDVRSY